MKTHDIPGIMTDQMKEISIKAVVGIAIITPVTLSLIVHDNSQGRCLTVGQST